MEGIGEQGLFIIAALVIAFINWLSGTLKKKKAARHDADEHNHDNRREANEESFSHADHDSWPAPDSEQGLPVTDMDQAANDPNREIREFFDALAGTPQPEVAPVAIVNPPDPPDPPDPPVVAPIIAAYKRPDDPHDNIPGADSVHNHRVHPIISQFRREGGARQAFIFSEILGKPKALRESGN